MEKPKTGYFPLPKLHRYLFMEHMPLFDDAKSSPLDKKLVIQDKNPLLKKNKNVHIFFIFSKNLSNLQNKLVFSQFEEAIIALQNCTPSKDYNDWNNPFVNN